MKLGIQISSVKKYLQTAEDVMESFKKCADIGYKYIQIQWIGEKVSMGDVKKALDESGLICTGTQDYYEDVIPQLDIIIKMNELWGSRHVCVSRIPDRFRTREGLGLLADEMHKSAKKLEAAGMILQFHPIVNDYDLLDGKPMIDILTEKMPQNVQILLDFFHVFKAGLDPVERTRQLKGRVEHVHFKDSKKPGISGIPGIPGKQQETRLTPVGQGEIDWPPIIRACNEAGVKFCFAEQEQWEKDAFLCLRESYDYIMGCLKN